MTIKRVAAAAACRGLYFDGIKAFRNNMVGTAYEILTPYSFMQSDTLEGLYKWVMEYKKIFPNERIAWKNRLGHSPNSIF